MSCGVGCARMMLIVFNVIFWLSGLAVLAVGIWMRVDDNLLDLVDFVTVGQDDNMVEYAAYLLIAIGSFAVIVGFCGCCGAIKKNKCLLGMYIFFLFMVMAGELAAGILVVVYKDEVEDKLATNLEDEMKDKEKNVPYIYKNKDDKYVFSGFGQLLSFAQNELECCGVGEGDHGYTGIEVLEGKQWTYLPTCCEDVKKDRKDLAKNPDVWLTPGENYIDEYITDFSTKGLCDTFKYGCVDKAKDWFKDKAVILIGVGIGIACLEIFGFIFAICLCRNTDE